MATSNTRWPTADVYIDAKWRRTVYAPLAVGTEKTLPPPGQNT